MVAQTISFWDGKLYRVGIERFVGIYCLFNCILCDRLSIWPPQLLFYHGTHKKIDCILPQAPRINVFKILNFIYCLKCMKLSILIHTSLAGSPPIPANLSEAGSEKREEVKEWDLKKIMERTDSLATSMNWDYAWLGWYHSWSVQSFVYIRFSSHAIQDQTPDAPLSVPLFRIP